MYSSDQRRRRNAWKKSARKTGNNVTRDRSTTIDGRVNYKNTVSEDTGGDDDGRRNGSFALVRLFCSIPFLV
jgi:hypothetical protein